MEFRNDSRNQNSRRHVQTMRNTLYDESYDKYNDTPTTLRVVMLS